MFFIVFCHDATSFPPCATWLLWMWGLYRKKSFILNDFVSSTPPDFLLVSETWLEPGEHTRLLEVFPPGYNCYSSPRPSGRGGGLAAIYWHWRKCTHSRTNDYCSLEVLFKTGASSPVPLYIVPLGWMPLSSQSSQSSCVVNHDNILRSVLVDQSVSPVPPAGGAGCWTDDWY